MKHKPDLIKSALDEYIETIQCLFAGEMMKAESVIACAWVLNEQFKKKRKLSYGLKRSQLE
ncbi:hypothetical protein [Lacrimispora sp.]|uniref:hypothetical protein n=1 Tax=Lacrimispora sp. TaxID=2719234 RepID=UPI00286DAFC6|nr:hypothetical protein [Lacrimispora sp.]